MKTGKNGKKVEMKRDKLKWLKNYLAPALGCKITDVGVDKGFPYMVMEKEDGTKYRVEVCGDEHGNGPGFLMGLPPIAVED